MKIIARNKFINTTIVYLNYQSIKYETIKILSSNAQITISTILIIIDSLLILHQRE